MALLITGVAGFIASHVAVKMVNLYPKMQVVGIDKISYCSTVKNFKAITNSPNWHFYPVNLLSEDEMENIFKIHKITGVMHFAAESHVCNSFKNSIEFTKNNVLGTHILLELAKKFLVTRFIHVSTDETYGSKNNISTEDTILDPTNPYAATKAAAEHLVKSYYHSFKLPIIITRGNNVYGPQQYPEKVIPRFITNLLNGLPLTIQGSGLQRRSFLYIDDVVDAFMILWQKGVVGEIYNIGSEKEYTILDVAEQCISLVSSKQEIKYGEDRPFNDHRYFISSDKLKALGWTPKISFDEGLKLTYQWYNWLEKDYWTAS